MCPIFVSPLFVVTMMWLQSFFPYLTSRFLHRLGKGNWWPAQDWGWIQVWDQDFLCWGGFIHGLDKDEGDCRGLPRTRGQGRCRHSSCCKLNLRFFFVLDRFFNTSPYFSRVFVLWHLMPEISTLATSSQSSFTQIRGSWLCCKSI